MVTCPFCIGGRACLACLACPHCPDTADLMARLRDMMLVSPLRYGTQN